MNSRKTNLKLIKNITVEVPNTVSISKDILFHVSTFLGKWSSKLCLKLLSEFASFRSVGKLSKTIGGRYHNFFLLDHVFLKGCFTFKIEDLVFAWFWPDCLYISWKNRGQASLKNLKALEQRHLLNISETGSQLIFSKSFVPMWLFFCSWRQYLIHLFWKVCNLRLNFLSRFGYQAEQA